MKFLFFLLVVVGTLSGSELKHNLAFVHLGKEIPPCIYTVVKQARYLNQECDIFLLTDANAYPLFDPKFLAEERITLVDGDSLALTQEHVDFRSLIQVDPKLPDSYLIYTLERFFYLFDFMHERGLENLFHLENDTMLYVDLQELMPLFEKAPIQMATPFLSEMAAVPCFVFMKDKGSLRAYVDFVLFWAKHYKGPKAHVGVSDMRTLAFFHRKFGAERLMPLPTLMPEYGRYHHKRRSANVGDHRTSLDFFSRNAPLFPGYIFDAAVLGIFANGNDRKFSPDSKPGTIHFRSLFDPRHFMFYWGTDSKNRIVPYLSFRGNSYAIVNMHLYSKLPDGFTSYGEERCAFP